MIATILNIYLTKDLILLEEDWKGMVMLGLLYPYANWLGLMITGKPMYPVCDWSNVPLTLAIFIANAGLLGYVFTKSAKYICSKRPWVVV